MELELELVGVGVGVSCSGWLWFQTLELHVLTAVPVTVGVVMDAWLF